MTTSMYFNDGWFSAMHGMNPREWCRYDYVIERVGFKTWWEGYKAFKAAEYLLSCEW